MIQGVRKRVIKGQQNRLQGTKALRIRAADLIAGSQTVQGKAAQHADRRQELRQNTGFWRAGGFVPAFLLPGPVLPNQPKAAAHRHNGGRQRTQIIPAAGKKAGHGSRCKPSAPFSSPAENPQEICCQIEQHQRKGQRVIARSAVPVECLCAQSALRHLLYHQEQRQYGNASSWITPDAQHLLQQNIEKGDHSGMKARQNNHRCQCVPFFAEDGRVHGCKKTRGEIADPCPVIPRRFPQNGPPHRAKRSGALIGQPRSQSHRIIICRWIIIAPDDQQRNQRQYVYEYQHIADSPAVLQPGGRQRTFRSLHPVLTLCEFSGHSSPQGKRRQGLFQPLPSCTFCPSAPPAGFRLRSSCLLFTVPACAGRTASVFPQERSSMFSSCSPFRTFFIALSTSSVSSVLSLCRNVRL